MPEKWFRLMGTVTAGLLVAGVAAGLTLGPGREGERGHGAEVLAAPAAPIAAPVVTTPTVPPGPPPAYIATLGAPTSYSASPAGPPTGRLPATNPFDAPEVLALVGAPDGSGWLHVELPVRPNGTTAWIPAAGVTITETGYRVAVDLAARTITVTDAGHAVLTSPVAVGTPSTPTPPAETYVWELIRPDDPNGAYGPYILGLAEFSEAYSVFNGGDAQIGIHGQDEPWSIGKAASHGCIRLPNDVVTRLAHMLPLGTPVTIT